MSIVTVPTRIASGDQYPVTVTASPASPDLIDQNMYDWETAEMISNDPQKDPSQVFTTDLTWKDVCRIQSKYENVLNSDLQTIANIVGRFGYKFFCVNDQVFQIINGDIIKLDLNEKDIN